MKGIDRTILTLVSVSLSFIAAAACLLWMAERSNDLAFAPSLALSAMVALVVPLAVVAVARRLRPQLGGIWLFLLYMVVCALIITGFVLGMA